jgi:zinc protease
MSITKGIAFALSALLTQAAFAQELPKDPALRTGKLPNGFTYYIRHNEEPQHRALFYLVNKVGSVLEDDDQQGLAHFMEHMNFNGTTHYPKNQLVDYLQKAGVRFGADLNAYTKMNETVYELPIPTDDPSMVKSAVSIMRDWAQEATLDSIEVEKERGVILEEERLGKGAQDRLRRQFLPMLMNNSRYASRQPIGIDDVLLHAKPSVLKRFHHDWYRPDLQALVVVGDINVDEMEKMIKQQFATEKNPAHERPRPAYPITLNGANHFMLATDPELSNVSLNIFYKIKMPKMQTVADYEASLKRRVALALLENRRYTELNSRHDVAYIGSNVGIESLEGGIGVFAYDVTPKDGQLELAFKQTWEGLERIKRYGFTQQEMDKVKQSMLRSLDQEKAEKDKTPSSAYVGEYQSMFLANEAAPGFDWEYNYMKQHLNDVTLADVAAITKEYLSQTNNMDILVEAPEKERASMPDSATVVGWMKQVASGDIKPYKDAAIDTTLLPVKPTPGKVVSRTTIPELGITTLTLSNGVKVVLKPTTFKNDEISFRGFSEGGTSLVSDSDYDAAASADKLMMAQGLGKFDPIQLSNAMTGKAARVSPYIAMREQGVTGASNGANLETAMQLLYLEFTQPREDSAIFKQIISNSKQSIMNRYANPNNVFSDTIAYVMGNYNYRNSPPTMDKFDRITMEKTLRIYKDRFADASGFTFVFVGNFDVEKIQPLLEQYIGALPALNRHEKAKELGIHIPTGKISKVVANGTEDKATVRLVSSGDYEFSPVNNLLLNALAQILQIKMTEQLREEEGEVYSPSCQVMNNKLPRARYAFVFSFGCAPRNVDHLIDLVQGEMAKLRTNGVDAEDIQKYKAAYVKQVELALKENGFWLDYITGQLENNENMLDVQQVNERINAVTPESLKAAANKYLTGDNMIKFVLVPAENK